MAKAVQNIPTKDEIRNKKNELSQRIVKKRLKNVKAKNKENTPLQEFLLSIKDVIKKAVNSGATSAEIINGIKDIYKVDFSTSTFNNFCRSQGIKKHKK